MKNYAARCSKWLTSNPNIDEVVLNKEINRFNLMLEKIESSEEKIAANIIDDILSTLQLLDAAVSKIQPSKQAELKIQSESFEWDSSPLYHTNDAPEFLDKATKDKRLQHLLQHELIRKGIRK